MYDKELDRILRIGEVCELTRLSRSTIWRLEQQGDFPAKIQISQNVVGWRKRAILDWLKSRELDPDISEEERREAQAILVMTDVLAGMMRAMLSMIAMYARHDPERPMVEVYEMVAASMQDVARGLKEISERGEHKRGNVHEH